MAALKEATEFPGLRSSILVLMVGISFRCPDTTLKSPNSMTRHPTVFLLIFSLCQAITALAQETVAPIRLPLRVHLVAGVEMIREVGRPGAEPIKTVMGMPVQEADVRAMIEQVNEIWAPANIRWETEPKKGGGDIVTDQAGGGMLSKERLHELAGLVVARNREEPGDSMTKVFPALADPTKNETLLADGTPGKAQATFYHLYLFPYVGQTLQGTARCPGTFAVVGAYSDKHPNKLGLPKLRPFCIPAKPGTALSSMDFPADGALSATMAHELGHNLGLTHSDEGMKDNLMKGHVKLRLSPGQILAARKRALAGPHLP